MTLAEILRGLFHFLCLDCGSPEPAAARRCVKCGGPVVKSPRPPEAPQDP